MPGGWSGPNFPIYAGLPFFVRDEANNQMIFTLQSDFNAYDYEVDGETKTFDIFALLKSDGMMMHGPCYVNSILYVPAEVVAEPVVCDNIAAMANLSEEEAQNVKLILTDAKVTYVAENAGTIFVEDVTAAMQLYVMNEDYDYAEIADMAQGKAVTGSIVGTYFEGGMFMAMEADVDITSSVDVDVTYGAAMTVAQALETANVNKLATFTASESLTITNEEGMLIIAEGDNQILVTDPFYSLPEDYEFPVNVSKVTGVIVNYGMLMLAPRSEADIVAAEPAAEYTVYFDNSASQWETVYAYVWNDDANLAAWPGEEMTKGEADVWSYTITNFEPTSIIFSNGNGQQTADLAFENGKTYVGEAPASSKELYLRGSINDWGTSLKFETADEVTYTLTVAEAMPAGAEFKIANADWSVSYTYDAAPIEPNVEYTFVDGNGGPGNAKTAVEIPANAKITFNVETLAFKLVAEFDGINAIDAEDGAEYYSLQGVRLAKPAVGQPCIRVANGVATKVIVK
ncbi:MAG: starch-binding protein, partial [Muribaculaceae bacterium]|nr:starch-binding protein [Muribaculaceae bacterium]